MLFLWRSSQLRRSASSAIAMFPGLRHSSLAYYGAVPLQTKVPPTITAAADGQMLTFAHSHTRPSPKTAVVYVCRGEG